MIFSYWLLIARTICVYPLLLYGCGKKGVLISILFCFMDAGKKSGFSKSKFFLAMVTMVLSMFHFAINVQDVLLGKVVCHRSLKYYLLKIVADNRLDEKLVFPWCY
jgi:hypothetical protein